MHATFPEHLSNIDPVTFPCNAVCLCPGTLEHEVSVTDRRVFGSQTASE